MTASLTEKAQRRSGLESLPPHIVQAVLAHQKNLRTLKDVERRGAQPMSPARKMDHIEALGAAMRNVRESRCGLESVLVEDV